MSNVGIIQDTPWYGVDVPKRVDVKPRTTRAATARKRKWERYIYENRFCGDCQLVTAVNAYYFLTGKTVSRKAYDQLAKDTACTSGAAIGIDKAHKRLGIRRGDAWSWVYDWVGGRGSEVVDRIKLVAKLPLEVTVWHKGYGFHSVLIVDFEPVTRSVRVTGFKKATNDRGWMYWEDFHHYTKTYRAGNEPPFVTWTVRTFEKI